jgi:RNA polymerase primary sigma factor
VKTTPSHTNDDNPSTTTPSKPAKPRAGRRASATGLVAPANEQKARPRAPSPSREDELEAFRLFESCRQRRLGLALQAPTTLAELASLCHELEATELARRLQTESMSPADLRRWRRSLLRLQRLARPHWDRLGRLSAKDGTRIATPLNEREQEIAAAKIALERNRALCLKSARRAAVPEEVLQRLTDAVVRGPKTTGTERRETESPPTLLAWLAETTRDVDAVKAQIVATHQGLVGMVAGRYAELGLSSFDLKQEGNIGLMRAVEKFDPSRGVRFGTYAVWWIRQAVQRALSDQSRTIRLPVHVVGQRLRVASARSRLMGSLGRPPTVEELAQEAGLRVSQLEGLQVREPLSLEAERGADNDARLIDMIADVTEPSAFESLLVTDERARVDELLAELSPRECTVMRMRFGIEGGEEHTLEQVGQALGVTRERARQIINRGLKKLRKAAARRKLEVDFTN